MIENLSYQTTSKALSWTPKSNTNMEVEIEEIKFSFSVNWKLELNTGWSLSNGWLNVKSTDFDFTIYSHDFPDLISQIRDFLYNEHFSKFKPSDQEVIDKVENITKKISIQSHRDKKLSNLLDSYDKR